MGLNSCRIPWGVCLALAVLAVGGCKAGDSGGASSPGAESSAHNPAKLPVPNRPRTAQVDGPPAQSQVDLSQLPDPEPRAEPRSRRGNPETYEVLGKTYRLLPTATGYDAVGRASWYGRKFHGRLTSSGEPFDMYQLTAAHRQLPIPVYVEVTNLANQKQTIVRVNDRGPFHSDRILDLSYAAAVKLGFHHDGTAQVRVRVVEPASAAPVEANQFFLQAGAFRKVQGAQTLRAQLTSLSQVPTFVVQIPADRLFRVRLGPFSSREAAREQQLKLAAAQYPGALILSAEKVIRDGACLPQC